MVNYRKFNFACLALFGFFLIGTMWVWRPEISHSRISQIPETTIVLKTKQAKSVAKQPIPTTEELLNDSNDNETIGQLDNENVVSEENIEPQDAAPSEINLPVPFTSQAPEKNWDQPWQDACEEAAVLMLDAYYKNYGLSPLFAKDELIKLVGWEENQGWGGSIPMEKVEAVAQYLLGSEYSTRVIENPTVEQIKNFVAAGQPVLVVADGKVLPNPNFRNGGPVYHALIIRGYTEDKFITNDPGTQFGENFMYEYEDLMEAIKDWNGGDVKSGRRVVLVVE